MSSDDDDRSPSWMCIVDPAAENDPDIPEPVLCRWCPCDCLRWSMLGCISLFCVGSYWTFDIPGAIYKQLQTWFGTNYGATENLNLYSIYSWPNILLSLIGGFLIDRSGIRRSVVLFASLVLIGQLVFSFGVQFKNYWVCLGGRFIFGLGGESLNVAQSTFIARWFSGESLALAFGTAVASSRFATAATFAVTPYIANQDNGVPIALWVGTGLCALSLFAVLSAVMLDWYGEPRFRSMQPYDTAEATFSIRDVKNLTSSMWLMSFICFFFYIGLLPFYAVASDILQNTGLKYDDQTASLFIAIPSMMGIPCIPFFGRIVDTKGRALYFIVVASVMMVIAHLVFLLWANDFVSFPPVPVFVWMGVAYSMGAASIWPTLSYSVESKLTGTAYGCMTSLQNFGLAVVPLTIGILQDMSHIRGTLRQYNLPLFIFIASESVACGIAFLLIKVDKQRNDGRMNANQGEREEQKFLTTPHPEFLEGQNALLGGPSFNLSHSTSNSQLATTPILPERRRNLSFSQSPR